MSFTSIAIFIVTLAFAIISIYIAKLLLRVSRLIQTLGQTVDRVEGQMDSAVEEIGSLIEEVEVTATDVENKLIASDGLFLTIQNIGDAASIISTDLHDKVMQYRKAETLPGTQKFIRIIQWGEFANKLFTSWKIGQKTSI